MNGLKDLVGRRFRFERSGDGKLEPVAELPSATWIHSDDTIQPMDLPKDTPISYSKLDSEFVTNGLILRDRRTKR